METRLWRAGPTAAPPGRGAPGAEPLGAREPKIRHCPPSGYMMDRRGYGEWKQGLILGVE